MKRRKTALIIFLLYMTMILASCGRQDGGKEADNSEEGEKVQIGMSFDSFVIERWQRDRDVFVSMAKELGAEVNVQNANGNIEEQKKQIEYFIKKEMDVIVIICIDSDGLKEQVQKAKEAGIKIIAYDRLIIDADVDLYITFDNEKVGTMMGEALVQEGISGGKVLMLGGSAADNNVYLVEKGFRRVMEENGVTILDSIHAEGWKAEVASAYIYDHMGVVEQADAIMCGNDDLASKTVHALAERKMAGSILVVGQDADLEACQRIVEGTQVMTVYKSVEKLAQRAAECAVLLAKDEPLEGADVTTIDNGSYRIAYVGLEPVSVNEENINEVIIGSGFHLKEDVYLNVPGKMPK
ncbi:MAG: substrate-binding domain-containing protein [Lachnospiraceae bacterium]|nr:substrate-binding domain-containing protein [Lachnospiraceae bacterium]MDE6186491.1 substrate-binding domain-containing protein [Lachnospiraceae bacterium]